MNQPAVIGTLESALYTADLEASERFFREVIGLELIHKEPGRHVFLRSGQGVLLLFNPEATSTQPTVIAGVLIPLHGARGQGHVAFAVREADLPAWRARLEKMGVPVECELAWPAGGHSIYLRDPGGNSVELATPRLWGLPEPA